MTDIVERLKEYAEDDHERGCAGRCYDCSCGYDGKRDPLLNEAAAEIERLKAEVSALNHAEVKLLVQVDEQDAEIERLREAIKRAIRQHEEGNKGLAHRTLCEAVYGPQA